jgi:Leucine-rich repeat (LRR) protein
MNNNIFSIRLLYFLCILCLLSTIKSCKKITDSTDEGPPIANAGPDRVTLTGSYAILDGSKSTLGSGKQFEWIEWTADENNPAEAYLYPGAQAYHLIQNLCFIKEGIYKFTLVVNNGIQDSESDEVIVTVNPRGNIVFDDPSLEAYVRWALKKPVEELNDSVLALIDSIYSYEIISNEKVTSLNGIEKCINLKYLAMGHQRISDLSPLVNLINLEYLNLTQNRIIQNIQPLARLVNLKFLNLDSNDITDFSPLQNLKNLTYLNVMFNPFSDFSVLSELTKLEELWLSNLHKPIANISSLENLINLRNLWLSACQITDITPLANLKDLKSLFLKHNSINDISALSGLTNLERLYLSSNQIVDISALEYLINLSLLKLRYNQITNILPLVNNSGLGEGDIIDLNDNPLDSLSINEYIPVLENRGVFVGWN